MSSPETLEEFIVSILLFIPSFSRVWANFLFLHPSSMPAGSELVLVMVPWPSDEPVDGGLKLARSFPWPSDEPGDGLKLARGKAAGSATTPLRGAPLPCGWTSAPLLGEAGSFPASASAMVGSEFVLPSAGGASAACWMQEIGRAHV